MSEAEETSLQIKICWFFRKYKYNQTAVTELSYIKKKTWENGNNLWHKILPMQQDGFYYEKNRKTKDTNTLAWGNLLPLHPAWPWLHPGAHSPLSLSLSPLLMLAI